MYPENLNENLSNESKMKTKWKQNECEFQTLSPCYSSQCVASSHLNRLLFERHKFVCQLASHIFYFHFYFTSIRIWSEFFNFMRCYLHNSSTVHIEICTCVLLFRSFFSHSLSLDFGRKSKTQSLAHCSHSVTPLARLPNVSQCETFVRRRTEELRPCRL